MNKRGQIFLMAAIIIIGVIVGVSTISTEVEVGNSGEAFYDLSEEVGFETKRVLDYGIFNSENLDYLLGGEEGGEEGFFSKYIDYLGREQVVLIVGDASDMIVYYFLKDGSGNVGINTGGQDISINPIIPFFESGEANVNSDGTSVTVLISGIDYEFDLRDGENFFFVIIKHEDGEKFVAVG